MALLIYTLLLCTTCVFGKSLPEDQPLNLTPLLENNQTETARKLSAVDPTLFAGVKSHAGYFNVNKTEKWNTFFWYFPAEGSPSQKTPLVIWLQGGPGASSLYGLFTEIGPLEVINGTVKKMSITWNTNYSLLFIDNPVGTGFSYSEGGKYAADEDEVGASLLSLLQQFLDVFPEVRKSPLFLSGESYAGKYIPAFGHYIHNNKDKSKPINLRGLAIGDGWTDPPTLLYYSEWALQIGLVDQSQADILYELEDNARKAWKEDDFETYALEAELVYTFLTSFAPGIDNYNYIKDESSMDAEFIQYLNRDDVQTALHVQKQNYVPLAREVYSYLYEDRYKTVKPWLEELLEHYGVMCFSGQLDMIVAYALSVHTYRSLKWSGAEKYLNASRLPIYDSDNEEKVNSFIKSYGNFWDVMVRGAGHMVPTDKPRAAKQILDLFIGEFKN